jgi:hypothetical protein
MGDKFSLPIRVVTFSDRFVRTLGFSLKEDDTNPENTAADLLLNLTADQLSSIGEHVTKEINQLCATL